MVIRTVLRWANYFGLVCLAGRQLKRKKGRGDDYLPFRWQQRELPEFKCDRGGNGQRRGFRYVAYRLKEQKWVIRSNHLPTLGGC